MKFEEVPKNEQASSNTATGCETELQVFPRSSPNILAHHSDPVQERARMIPESDIIPKESSITRENGETQKSWGCSKTKLTGLAVVLIAIIIVSVWAGTRPGKT